MARNLAAGLSLAYCLLTLPFAAAENSAVTYPVQDIPSWAVDASLALTLTTSGDASPLQYTVIPLTPAVGLNESNTALRTINILGNLIAADASNYKMINNSREIAYLSCDDSNGGMDAISLLHELMEVKPDPLKSILLYTTSATWCDLDWTYGNLVYGSIFTMADPAEAANALSFLNDTDNGEIVKASIYGNVTESPSQSAPANHSIAMTVLYSVVGVIVVMFVIIIGVGTIRAHRHPERYGPRRAGGGRVRQSRARGIARAVLDTIPIVPFRNPSDPKPDPEVDLHGRATAADNADATEVVSDPASGGLQGHSSSVVASQNSPGADLPSPVPGDPKTSDNDSAGLLGCSICTEDFTIGEDVRVLPCKHQFHPACVDYWLINVAGTCPLCRYNLSPQTQDDAATTSSTTGQTSRLSRHTSSPRSDQMQREEQLPPPLGEDVEGATAPQRNRLSRFFDINRLRNAPVEERVAALRQLREEEASEPSQSVDGEERRRRAGRFTERLRETFRVQTRAQSSQGRTYIQET